MSTTTTAVPTPPRETSPAATNSVEAPIIYFDGVCGLCNRSVDRVLAWDRGHIFRFAPLQGETAAARLSPAETQQLGSLVVEIGGRSYRKSAGIVRILWQLGGLAGLGGTLLWLVPLPLRDLGYQLVASNRYRIGGKKETCRMPTKEERARFLP